MSYKSPNETNISLIKLYKKQKNYICINSYFQKHIDKYINEYDQIRFYDETYVISHDSLINVTNQLIGLNDKSNNKLDKLLFANFNAKLCFYHDKLIFQLKKLLMIM